MVEFISKKYSNGEITKQWQPKSCQHTVICVKTLPKLYNPKASPWIAIKHASSEELISQISYCPSGALCFTKNQ